MYKFLCKMKMINSVEYEALRNQSDSQNKVWQNIYNWLINYSSKVKCTHKSEVSETGCIHKSHFLD